MSENAPPQLRPHLFQPGNPGGPGRGKQWLKQGDIKEVVGAMMKMTRAELKKFLNRQSTTMLEIILGQIIVQAAKKGDPMRMEFILNRVIGRSPQALEEMERLIGQPLMETVRPDGTVVRMKLPDSQNPEKIVIDPEKIKITT